MIVNETIYFIFELLYKQKHILDEQSLLFSSLRLQHLHNSA